jgi:uncharacterized protein YjbJ (UPF0337 family)
MKPPFNRNVLAGNWKQLKGKVKENWGRLTDDDLDVIEGRWEQLSGKIQERYGVLQAEADRQIREWQHAVERSEKESAASSP